MKESGAHFFEGTEKLLEVWFARQQPAQQEPHQSKGSGDLRTIPRSANGRGGVGSERGEAAAGPALPSGAAGRAGGSLNGPGVAALWGAMAAAPGEGRFRGGRRWGLGSRAAGRLPAPPVTAPACPRLRDLPPPSRDPRAGRLPSSRPAGGGGAGDGSHSAPPPRAAPRGSRWQHVAEPGVCRAGRSAAGGAGAVSQCCWRPGHGSGAHRSAAARPAPTASFGMRRAGKSLPVPYRGERGLRNLPAS